MRMSRAEGSGIHEFEIGDLVIAELAGPETLKNKFVEAFLGLGIPITLIPLGAVTAFFFLGGLWY